MTKLAEHCGMQGKEYLFENIEKIRAINSFPDSLYDYFLKICPRRILLEIDKAKYFYADMDFPHGCHSWRLNEIAYIEIGKRIRASLTGKDGESA